MKVVIAHRTGQPRVVDLAEPHGGRQFLTVRLSHSVMVLPDELHAIESAGKRVKSGDDGIPLGFCASGTVMAAGEGVRSLKTGLRVAVAGRPYVYHASHVVVPEHLAVELPKKVNHEEGAFAGLGAVALDLVRAANIQIGEAVLVFGADIAGLLTAQIVRAAGAIPVLVDDSDFRLGKARALGIAHHFQPEDEDLLRTVETLTGGHGADAALLTRPGDKLAWSLATNLLRTGAPLILSAPPAAKVPLDLVMDKRLTLRVAGGGGPGIGDPAYEIHGAGYPRSLTRWTVRDNMQCFCTLLAERKVQITPLITDRIPLDRATSAYEKAARGRDAVLGVILTIQA